MLAQQHLLGHSAASQRGGRRPQRPGALHNIQQRLFEHSKALQQRSLRYAQGRRQLERLPARMHDQQPPLEAGDADVRGDWQWLAGLGVAEDERRNHPDAGHCTQQQIQSLSEWVLNVQASRCALTV